MKIYVIVSFTKLLQAFTMLCSNWNTVEPCVGMCGGVCVQSPIWNSRIYNALPHVFLSTYCNPIIQVKNLSLREVKLFGEGHSTYKFQENRICVCTVLLNFQNLAQCLTQGRFLISICWINDTLTKLRLKFEIPVSLFTMNWFPLITYWVDLQKSKQTKALTELCLAA